MANEDVIITPDMTPEEIAAMQNPGAELDDSNLGRQPQTQQGDNTSSGAATPNQVPSGDNRDGSMEGRVAAAMRESEESKRRADLLEQNNQFLTQRAADIAEEAKQLRTRAEAADAERANLARKIEQANSPKLSQAEVDKLVEEHGEYGAKPFISMQNQMLEMGHRHKLELDSLKDSTANLPKQIDTALGKQQDSAKAAAFNAALMDAANGVPELGTLLKDPDFVKTLQSDPWGKLQPFNAALASNDILAVSSIKKIVAEFKAGGKSEVAGDPGTSGAGRSAPQGGSGDASDRDSLITEWNGMLDRGEIVKAQAFASKHKLMD